MRYHLFGCKMALEHLKGRKLQSVTVSIYTKLIGDDKHTELFRAVMTQADLTKVAASADMAGATSTFNDHTALAGTVYDPRGPKIGECWKVELNLYPDLEYKKK